MAKRNRAEAGASFAANDQILLGVLTAIERDSNISQRNVSSELGVALGLTNAYLRRCVRKGLIKIQQVPRRRYVYYLTPNGFAEKARLTGQYLSASFTFFRRARQQLSEIMADCAAKGWRRIVLAGVSDLAEVATLCARDYGVELVGILDATHAGQSFGGLKVYGSLNECGIIDAVIVTSLTEPEQIYRALEADIGPDRLFAPHLLRIRKVAMNSKSVAPRELPSEAAE